MVTISPFSSPPDSVHAAGRGQLETMIELHGRLCGSTAEPAATRIASGAMRVRRDSNPNRNSAVTFTHLGKLNPIQADHLQDLMKCFGELAQVSDSDSPVVLGLAESGIIPSFAMQQACLELGRQARWLWTSRRDNGGPGFREPHSHAPAHYLPSELFDQPIDEVWVVEDEITTGKTLENLAKCLRENASVNRIRVFSLLDTRGAADTKQMNRQWFTTGMICSVESVLTTEPNFWSMDPPDREPIEPDSEPRRLLTGEAIASGLPSLLSGEVARLQHVTLSPWLVDGYNVLSRTQLHPKYFLYNAGEVLDA